MFNRKKIEALEAKVESLEIYIRNRLDAFERRFVKTKECFYSEINETDSCFSKMNQRIVKLEERFVKRGRGGRPRHRALLPRREGRGSAHHRRGELSRGRGGG